MSRRAAGAPRRLAVIGDMPHHRDAEGRVWGLEPVVAQLDRWAELFDELVLCGPLLPGPPPSGFRPYANPEVSLVELRRAGGNTLLAKLGLLPRIPGWFRATRRLARSVDAVHLRCPCNIGLVAIASTWRAAPYRYAIYAGVWHDYEGEPRFFRLQRRLLASRWFGGPVSVYAGPDAGRPHLEPFFSPSFDEADWRRGEADAEAVRARIRSTPDAGPWRLAIVGRLTPNKNQQSAVRALALLVEAGFDVALDVVGEGPERDRLVALATGLGVIDRVHLHGMVDHARVLDVFRGADLQLLTTRQEGYGKVLLESMVLGVVPIFSRSPVSDQISGGGTRAVVIDPDRPEQVAAAVRGLIEDRDRWLAMVDDARAVTEGLTLEAFGRRTRELLERQWGVSLAGPRS